MSLEDLTPSNRFELALSGDMTAEEASNRIEKILAGADIEPADRLEYFLKLRVSGGGGGEPSPLDYLHYAGTFEALPSNGTAHTYEIPFNVDPATVALILTIPHDIATYNHSAGGAFNWANPICGQSPDGGQPGFLDPTAKFRIENGKIILDVGTWKYFATGPTDIVYMLMEG